jgi:hypothetical protein
MRISAEVIDDLSRHDRIVSEADRGAVGIRNPGEAIHDVVSASVKKRRSFPSGSREAIEETSQRPCL